MKKLSDYSFVQLDASKFTKFDNAILSNDPLIHSIRLMQSKIQLEHKKLDTSTKNNHKKLNKLNENCVKLLVDRWQELGYDIIKEDDEN